MIKMQGELYESVKRWMHQNARPIELCLWQYFLKMAVGKKLSRR